MFGSRLWTLGLSLVGPIDETSAWVLASLVVDALKMTPAPGATLCRYPVEGKGGVGFSLFFPITESFVVIDAWPEIGGLYLFVCSCREFDPSTLSPVLSDAGLRIVENIGGTLSLGGKTECP